MPDTRWIKVDATIVECFRAWDEPPDARHPLFEIIADIKTPSGRVERVSSQQRLHTHTHHWRAPEPGAVVAVSWAPASGELRLNLGRDARYNEKLIKALGRTRDAPWAGPPGVGGGGPA